KQKFGIPRQGARVKELCGKIIFVPEFRNPDALRKIEEFSHLWLIFDFSKSHREKWSPTVRPPRLGGNERIGVFASRSPFRPNSIGLSCVKLESVGFSEKEGYFLNVSGVDLLDNTPIYDIKPYVPMADCFPDARGGYSDENAGHLLEVEFSEKCEKNKIPESDLIIIKKCISEDPRPSYQEDESRIYRMKYKKYDVCFTVKGKKAIISEIIADK
ncbi:MAG: tRNA (N6-threonylcarbamoyladenosine(37)-N6)-methyltransferase TrmO, partial [Clostridia bacterium]|nr:tRNA (N6-threonylcarbamoyladenosine(37)-N6)-methyltransferase TrmO [Clostridia bacterium]